MARVNKSLRVESGYPHRNHRSKKGQEYIPYYNKIKDFKRKKLEMKEKDADRQIESYKQLTSRKKWYTQ